MLRVFHLLCQGDELNDAQENAQKGQVLVALGAGKLLLE